MARRSDHTREELRALALKSARAIVREEGVSRLSTRKVADKIGYTSGTLYQVFRNRDDLVEQMNAETLHMLFEKCSPVQSDRTIHDRLSILANGFVAFANERPDEWAAVINYTYATDHEWSKLYDKNLEQLLGLLVEATAELYTESGCTNQMTDVRLLWQSLYGIFSLGAANRLGKDQSVEASVDALIELYLSARVAEHD